MAEYSETDREARRRATEAVLDDLYKRTADTRGEMMRASRRAYTAEPERGMSPDGEAAARAARALAPGLVEGSSEGARRLLDVRSPSGKGDAPLTLSERALQAAGFEPTGRVSRDNEMRHRAIMDRTVKRNAGVPTAAEYERDARAVDRGEPMRKSGKGADMGAEARALRGRQASADAEYKRRAVVAPLDREAVADDLAERRAAGLMSPEAMRRALEALQSGRSREDTMRDMAERRDAGLLSDDELRRFEEAMGR